MRKLRLDLDTLRVQSFATRDTGTFPFGTVHAGQKEPTGWHDPHCSAVLPCESRLGCSEVATCQPTRNQACPSAEAACPSGPDCPPEEPSSAGPSRHAWTVIGPACKLTEDCCQSCRGPAAAASYQDPGGS